MKWSIHDGDCLDVLPTLGALSFDALITDPPYMIGAVSVGNSRSKSGTWADMMNVSHWYAAWLGDSRRLLKDTGHALVFCNWRTIPTLIRAFDLCSWPVTSCLVWDKEWIGPGGPAGFRPRHEIILHAAMPDARIADRSLPDVLSEKWMAGNMRTTEHPAEKPVPLLESLCRTVADGGAVLDPFAGSGTTGVGAIRAGCSRFVGIEAERTWADVARTRLDDAARQVPMFAEATCA